MAVLANQAMRRRKAKQKALQKRRDKIKQQRFERAKKR